MTPIAALRSDFSEIAPEQIVKKFASRFERPPSLLRLMNVGAVIPPHRLYPARAPIHPKRPYGFDPSGCPPGRVFYFRLHRFASTRAARQGGVAALAGTALAMPPCGSAA
jgi:hypothetical protein